MVDALLLVVVVTVATEVGTPFAGEAVVVTTPVVDIKMIQSISNQQFVIINKQHAVGSN